MQRLFTQSFTSIGDAIYEKRRVYCAFAQYEKEMFCTKCGNQLKDTDNFCSSCGARVSAQTNVQAQPAAQQPTPKAQMLTNTCEACGGLIKKIAKGHYLCEYCGSEYFTVDSGEITERKLTEKEILDIFLEAANYETKNMFVQELQCLLSAVDKAPENATLLIKLGRSYRRNNMYSKAIECYEKASTLKPSDATIYTNMGAVYISINQFAKAEPYCKRAIALMNNNRIEYTDNDYAIAHSNCAIAVGKLGKLKEAKDLLAKAEANGYKNGDTVRKMIGIKKGLFW